MEKEVAVYEINPEEANDEIRYMGGRVVDNYGNNVLIVLFPLDADLKNTANFTREIPADLPEDTWAKLEAWRAINSDTSRED